MTACVNCHDLKDRTPLDRWPLGATVEAIRGLISVLPPIPLRVVDQPEQLQVWLMEAAAARPDVHLNPAWARASAATRILYAKLLFGHGDRLSCRTS